MNRDLEKWEVAVAIIATVLFFWWKADEVLNPPPPPPPKPAVYNDPIDGQVDQVYDWLHTNLKDPDSMQVIRWWKLSKRGKGYGEKVRFRAKNSFGGYEISTYYFELDAKGNITGVIPLQ